MQYDPLYQPFPSRRTTVYGKKGMVATAQNLAAMAGMDILKKGGNAIDAAIATAACLTIVEPCSNGIGGDAFALIWHKGKLHGLNASGAAPLKLTGENVRSAGHEEMPLFGWFPVTIPGVPAAWAEMSAKFGRLTLPEVLEPAIKYAEEGHPVSPTVAKYWDRAFKRYEHLKNEEKFSYWFKTFAPGGRPPKAGETWQAPDHARSLKAIAESGGEDFYRGRLAEKIIDYAAATGGFITKEDLEAFRPKWVEPIGTSYRGYNVWEIPPNGQGLVALIALNILQGFEFKERNSADTVHKQIEAVKLAFADGLKHITDPAKMTIKTAELLSEEYAAERRKMITEEAVLPEPGKPPQGGTVYMAAADAEGNMISFIQSNFLGFGSGLVVPETGIALHNRGKTFSLDPAHSNYLEPGKKTFHTIIPGFLTKGKEAVGPFGVMGAYMQPQGHVQVIMDTVDFGLNPQATLDAPRWRWIEKKSIELERYFPMHIGDVLQSKGHDIQVSLDPFFLGRGQIIWEIDGVLAGGTDPRLDGAVAAW